MESKLIKSVMSLWPSKKQWKSWTLPSKLAGIGTFVAIVSLSLFLLDKGCQSSNNYLSRSDLHDIVRTIAAEHRTELSKKYPTAHTVFGIYQDGFVVPKGEVPSGIKVKWETGRVIEISSEVVHIVLPDIIGSTDYLKNFFIAKNNIYLPKKIGAKTVFMRSKDFSVVLEILGVDNELVIVGLGLAPKD